MSEKLKKYFGEKITYDDFGQFIWAVDKTGGCQKVADIRGWGHIQHLFPNTEEGQKEAAKFQDEVGQFIADAISEKVKKLNEGN